MMAPAPSCRVSSLGRWSRRPRRRRRAYIISVPGDLPQRTATGIEQAVQDPVDIGDDGEADVEVGAVGGEPRRVVGEGDHDREGVTELVEVIAHGEHMLLAR